MATLLNEVPPSVDLKSPSPASESEEPLGSPVPTQTLPSEPIVTDPIALDGRLAPTEVHVGDAARALVVFQRPPPAVPAYSVQEATVQAPEVANDVVRPDTCAALPV